MLIHSERGFQPRIFPEGNSGNSAQINRAQSITPAADPTYLTIRELGRNGKVKSIRQSESVTNRLLQYENGEMDIYRAMANSPLANSLTLNDFASSLFGISAYLKDDKGAFKGTIWYPGQRLTSIAIEAGDPKGAITRTFDFIGDDVKILQSDNGYLIDLAKIIGSSDTPTATITIGSGDYADYPTPVEDPNNTGSYILRVVRTRGNDVTTTTDWSYDPSNTTITLNNTETGDIFKVYYSAASYIANSLYWQDNDTELAAALGHQCSLYIATNNYLHRMESARINVAMTREDNYELGQDEAFARGITSNKVTLTLGKIIETYTLEELISGKTSGWGIISPDIFSSDITFYFLVYEDVKKTTLKVGYKITGLYLSSWTPGDASVENYLKGGVTLDSDNLQIANNTGDLGL